MVAVSEVDANSPSSSLPTDQDEIEIRVMPWNGCEMNKIKWRTKRATKRSEMRQSPNINSRNDKSDKMRPSTRKKNAN